MAYHADDAFLPSWGSGMRPREPVEYNEESFSGFEDYPPKPKKFGTPPGTTMLDMDQLTTYDQPEAYESFPEQEPLLRGQATEEVPTLRRVEGVQRATKSLFLVWWPAFLGVCVTAAFGLGYWRHRLIVHEALFLVLVIGAIMLVAGLRGGWPGKMSMTFMTVNGCCIIFMGLVGAVLGLVCFQTYTKSYEIYRGSQFYDGVLPGINPGAHRDAGIIEFAPGSYVDVEHSIGIRNGDTYCVAPIMNPDSNGYSGFWAAGMNCCRARGQFRCGDVTNAAVRSGMMVLDENYFGQEEIPEYTKAAEQAAVQFNVGMPTNPIFVRWSSDTGLDKDQYWHDAFNFVICSAIGIFAFMLCVSASMSYLGSGDGDSFAHSYYSIEVYDTGDDEQSQSSRRRSKKGKKAQATNYSAYPFSVP